MATRPSKLVQAVPQAVRLSILTDMVEQARAADRLVWKTITLIVENGTGVEEISAALNISRSTIYRRVAEYRASEAEETASHG